MQQLFPQPGETVPRLRFPEFRDMGKWEFILLNKLTDPIKMKNSSGKKLNVLTNSAEYGVVDQQQYFNKSIATNTAKYYVVDKGDFVYSPRISSTAPVGPISKNLVGRGVMSPIYTNTTN